MKKVMLSLFGAMLAAGMLAGCGNVDENKTPAQVKEEAATWDAAKIEKDMKEYRDVTDAKKAELSKVNDQLSEIPLKEKSGEKAGKLRDQAKQLLASIAKLETLHATLGAVKATK